MIKSINANLKYTINLTIPQSYEYDSTTQSVVLLKGYIYNLYYSNYSKDYQEIIDLRETLENVSN